METGSLHLKAREEFSSNLLQLLCMAWKSQTKSAVSSVLVHSSVISFQLPSNKGSSSLSDSARLRLGHTIILPVKIQHDRQWRHAGCNSEFGCLLISSKALGFLHSFFHIS